MKITGYKFRQALRELTQLSDVSATQFSNNLKVFPGEQKPDPRKALQTYVDVEDRIAKIQTAQTQYNLRVVVDVQGVKMPLATAVKLVGSAGRVEKMWRSVASPKPDKYYSVNTDTRDADTIVSRPVISVEEALKECRLSARRAAALREAIEVGNATEIDMDIDPSILDY